MLIKSFILSSLAVLSLALREKHNGRPSKGSFLRCGLGEPPKALIEQASAFQVAEQSLTSQDLVAAGSIIVKVYYHVVAIDESQENGYVPDYLIRRQHDVLNAAFRGSGMSFALPKIDYTINPDWAMGSNDTEMKTKLRKGRYQDLNIYITQAPMGMPGLLGVCTFPTYGAEWTPEFKVDGCTVHAETLPEGKFEEVNLGYVVVHEVGHWFGLLHTFQGGCIEGDFVDDTPAQDRPNFGCPKQVPDTCVGDDFPGLDPIHNYMDYSDDVCMNSFTVGQINRMKSFWNLWRKGM
ncbi:metalloprotease 1 [Pochonia chlamydosporia 170]|uniref:Metalloprotease 1 n=1 Tax=Pochonia chlamydosporia 170 TaxID=1380566 RepID=A0A179FS19_METCM|nr:metalloprotease 1 [Pochonia chlamydosporia 170]OAQ67809.1 metalloprotease 1 [Pochonia chlamydosporia 170]